MIGFKINLCNKGSHSAPSLIARMQVPRTPMQASENDLPCQKKFKQAGAELCQAQVKLEVVVEVGVEFGVKACHH